MRVVPVEFGSLDQAHDRRGTLAGAQRSGEEPVRSAECHRSDSVFDMVVTWHAPDRRPPALRAFMPLGVSSTYRDRGDGSMISGQAAIRQ
jgi:hypothetical protein